jgi:formate hydrogenlyase transcriptional activator
MELQTSSTAEELKQLQAWINDLASVLALPTTSLSFDSSTLTSALLDELVRVLRLDFAYIRVSDSLEGFATEFARAARRMAIEPHVIGRALDGALTDQAPTPSLVVPNPIDEGVVSLVVLGLGLRGELGRFAAASQRTDFPTQSERLLLQLAASQATITLQEARYVVKYRCWGASEEKLRSEILERTRAEERIRQDELELRLLVDFVRQVICEVNPDGTLRYMNRVGLEYFGRTLDELTESGNPRAKVYHPDDLGLVIREEERALAMGTPCELEARMRRHDGVYRWFSIRYEPRRDEQGRIVRWYGTGVDIEERKQAEKRTHAENLVLREEVDKASMFEEIVGASGPLRAMLSHVSKVAPTDSTVLITGETGTGKELVARAIHKRSQRSARVFVSVNCAAIPATLIASELFGHEKGAFTGAVQRRIGRFELADGGTIFLDEIGELPAETQMALLRVLQERQFERVGGGRPLDVDVRVIAATNRDLEAAMAAGIFRADLFYRLNVFPIHMPSLRDRREDIPLLVRYFVDRYSNAAGRKIKTVSRKSLDLLQSYSWPGNVRELQNVIERSIIVSETDTLTVDELWFLSGSAAAKRVGRPLAEQLTIQERTTIESALAETRGKVSGRTGAAAKLRISPSTLESRIKALRIDKDRFKADYP